jgi:excisionase family DNA binding protein
MAELLTIEEVAEILKLRPDTIRIKIRKGDFPIGLFFKMTAGEWRIDEADLRKYIEDLKRKPAKKL